MWVSVGAWGVSEESAPFLSRLMTQSAPTFIKRINESAVANRLFQKSTTRKISANLRLLVRERSRYDLKTMILSEDIMSYREKNRPTMYLYLRIESRCVSRQRKEGPLDSLWLFIIHIFRKLAPIAQSRNNRPCF